MSASTTLTRAELAAMIDHTLLAPEATNADVRALCEQAVSLDVFAACVMAARAPAAADVLHDSPVRLAVVVGFPSGAHLAALKVDEAARAIDDGADELDMVIDLGAARAGDVSAVGEEVAAVRAAAPAPTVLTAIIESALFDAEQIDALCAACEAGGADLVKTSTGSHPAGGASVAAVARIAAAVAPGLGVTASGGIHTADDALALVGAGATRLGMSRTAEVLDEIGDRR